MKSNMSAIKIHLFSSICLGANKASHNLTTLTKAVFIKIYLDIDPFFDFGFLKKVNFYTVKNRLLRSDPKTMF